MDRGFYIVASGMLTEQVRQDQLANDLANASTPGYKPDQSTQASFGDLLLQNSASGQDIGSLDLGVDIARTSPNLAEGAIDQTGEPLDVAIQGPGFFTVQTNDGTRYTRDGQFAVNAKGELTDSIGDPVLDAQGKTISIAGHTTDLKIGPDGAITAGGKTLGTIGLVSLTNPAKQGDNLFTGTPGKAPAGTTLEQGAIEGSGTNPASVMVDLITSMRSYESMQKVVNSMDETLQQGIQSGGAL
ncbi:MAG TPA: flagellar hook-basal body protein [Gaiellaceae bacterium]|nr:flagellar hook-basal body protein [Gaiellaceae bacterium]